MTRSTDRGAPDQVSFEVGSLEHLDGLVSIDQGSQAPWSRDAFAAEVGRDPPTLLVLKQPGGVAAFVAARFQASEMDIVNLAVASGLRRRGLGRFLLESLLDRAASMGVETAFLEVRESNQAARELYSRAGFKVSQRRPGFYREPTEDAILMRLEIARRSG